MIKEKLSRLWFDNGGIRINYLLTFFILFSLLGSVIILINDLGELVAARLQGYSSVITVNYGVRWPCKAGPCYSESKSDYPCFQMHEMEAKLSSKSQSDLYLPTKNNYAELLKNGYIKTSISPEENKYEELLKEVHIKSAIIRGTALGAVLILSAFCFLLIFFNSFKPGFFLYLNSVIAFSWIIEPCKLLLNIFFSSNQYHEFFIAQDLNFSNLFILIFLSIIGIIVCGVIFFLRIPKLSRISFLIAFIVGFPLGFFIWFKLIGPILFQLNC